MYIGIFGILEAEDYCRKETCYRDIVEKAGEEMPILPLAKALQMRLGLKEVCVAN